MKVPNCSCSSYLLAHLINKERYGTEREFLTEKFHFTSALVNRFLVGVDLCMMNIGSPDEYR